MKKWLSLWGPPLALMAVIFFLSHQPELPGPPSALWNRILKDGGHALGYFMLAVSYVRALEGYNIPRASALALVLSVLYALSDEWHQTFVPNRSGNWLDILIDFSGAVVGLYLWQRLRYRDQYDFSP